MHREPRPNSLRATWRVVSRSSTPRDCFADEIAIDFPSVDHAVERMRDAFLGEPASSQVLATDLHLSTFEARRGLIVPLEVPMRGTCAICSGRGGTWREHCEGCRGTGESLFHHPVRVAVPAGVADGARFRFRVSSPDARPVRVELRVAIRSSAA